MSPPVPVCEGEALAWTAEPTRASGRPCTWHASGQVIDRVRKRCPPFAQGRHVYVRAGRATAGRGRLAVAAATGRRPGSSVARAERGAPAGTATRVPGGSVGRLVDGPDVGGDGRADSGSGGGAD